MSIKVQPVQNKGKLPGGNGHLPGFLKINQIAYVGAHNAPCSKSLGWIYAQQRASLSDQIIKYGARFLKINLHWFLPADACCGCCNSKDDSQNQPRISIAHEPDGKTNCKLTILSRGFSFPQKAVVVLKQLADIIRQYPEEVFFIKFEGYLFTNKSVENGALKLNDARIQKEFETVIKDSGMNDLIYQTPYNYLNIPSLNDLRQGRNLLLFIDEDQMFVDNELARSYMKYERDYICQTNYDDNPLSTDFSKDLIHIQKDTQDQTINMFFEAHYYTEASFSFLSYDKKYNDATHVRQRYYDLSNFYKKKVNFLCADYIDEGQIAQVVDEINENEALAETAKLQAPEASTAFISPKEASNVDAMILDPRSKELQNYYPKPYRQVAEEEPLNYTIKKINE